MGYNVTIYAKERAPYIRSVRATGSWTPDSRITLDEAAPPAFPALWERMTRTSWAMYNSYLGSAGTPIEWVDHYALSDEEPRSRSSAPPDPNMPAAKPAREEPVHHFSRYRDRIADLGPRSHELPPGSTPFPTKFVSRSSAMTFNVASYAKLLMQEFYLAGGHIENREFRSPNEFGTLPQGVVICCTGYDSRALWNDESIVPVRGQIAWLIPQDGVQYGIQYKNLNLLARRDGIVMQPNFGGEDEGWNLTSEQPDHAAAEAGIKVLQDLYTRMEPLMQRRGSGARA